MTRIATAIRLAIGIAPNQSASRGISAAKTTSTKSNDVNRSPPRDGPDVNALPIPLDKCAEHDGETVRRVAEKHRQKLQLAHFHENERQADRSEIDCCGGQRRRSMNRNETQRQEQGRERQDDDRHKERHDHCERLDVVHQRSIAPHVRRQEIAEAQDIEKERAIIRGNGKIERHGIHERFRFPT
jgi:hypothetical protein